MRSGLSVILVAVAAVAVDHPAVAARLGFATAMALLGLGMGLIASQVGNVVQSSVDASGRSEAGGLQYTAQQLGSALGVALIGAIVLSGLTSTFLNKIEADPRITDQVEQQATLAVQGGVSFVSTDNVEQAADRRRTAARPGRRHHRQLRGVPADGAEGRPAGQRRHRPRRAGDDRGPAQPQAGDEDSDPGDRRPGRHRGGRADLSPRCLNDGTGSFRIAEVRSTGCPRSTRPCRR